MELNFQTAGETADALVAAGEVDMAKEGQHDQHLVVDSGHIGFSTIRQLEDAGWHISGVSANVVRGKARTFFHRD